MGLVGRVRDRGLWTRNDYSSRALAVVLDDGRRSGGFLRSVPLPLAAGGSMASAGGIEKYLQGCPALHA